MGTIFVLDRRRLSKWIKSNEISSVNEVCVITDIETTTVCVTPFCFTHESTQRRITSSTAWQNQKLLPVKTSWFDDAAAAVGRYLLPFVFSLLDKHVWSKWNRSCFFLTQSHRCSRDNFISIWIIPAPASPLSIDNNVSYWITSSFLSYSFSIDFTLLTGRVAM